MTVPDPLADPFSDEFTAEFGSGWNQLAATSGLSATITGLMAATAYNIRIVATNAAGATASNTITVVTI